MSTLEEVQTRIFYILVSNPKILTVLDLDISYLSKYEKRIPFWECGYKSLEKLLVKIPDISIIGKGYTAIVKVARLKHSENDSNSFNSGDSQCDSISWSKMKQKFKILNCLLENSKEISKPTKIQDEISNCRIPEAVQNNLKTLIAYFNEGLRYTKLPAAYQNCFTEVLDFRSYNYDSLLEMCIDLKDIFICFSVNDVIKLFHTDDAVAKYVITYAQVSENSTPLQSPVKLLSEDIFKKNICDKAGYPINTMKLLETIPRQFIPVEKESGDEIEVLVTDIYDLSKFWITLQSENDKFQEMHKNMQLWYKVYPTNYKIPEHLIKCGLYCVTMYEDQYYRGIVVKILHIKPCVKVFFIDFGTLSIVYKTKLLFLNKTFSELPQQAIRSRLGRIQPKFINTSWSEESFEEFLNLVSEKYMIATIVKKLNELQEVFVILVDKESKICINESLVRKNHAIFDLQKQEETPLDTVPSVNNIYLYPTFNEIEQGIVPTAEETHKLLHSSLDYDYIFPHYFKKPTPLDMVVHTPCDTESCSGMNHCNNLAVTIPSANTATDTSNNLNNSKIKQQLEFLIFMNIRNNNIAPLYYIQYLLRELSLMDSVWESIFNKIKEEIMSISSIYLQNYVTVVLNVLSIEKLLELYNFTHHTMSNMKFINKIGTNEITNGKLIGRSVLNGRLIYLFRINNQFYVDIRDIIEMMNLHEISLNTLQNQLDMLDFIRSILVISVLQSPLLIQELEQNTIPYLEYLIFLEVQFIPRFCEIFAGGCIPQSEFENFFEKVAIDGWCW